MVLTCSWMVRVGRKGGSPAHTGGTMSPCTLPALSPMTPASTCVPASTLITGFLAATPRCWWETAGGLGAGCWRPVVPPSPPPSLVYAVGATAGPVLVSWPGGPGGLLGLGGGTGPLVSPMGMAGGSGGLCEVSFSTSGPPVRRSVELHGATGSCMTPGTWVLAGSGVLLLLSLCLSICHLHRPTLMGHQPSTPMPPVSREDEGGLTYTQLSFTAPAGPTP
ncbi:uncharacterized protein LOC128146612 [Harpia harpyja]|uniref:uncharacterized protein LOC128146612 n=1 Tax=Harpia harpyja TaxID=202280 RepID=UPI0022B174BB|nr:uncharacterized protein LOC128146612 [Harpia harpyja]